MFLVQNMCCLLNRKAFRGSRVKSRWCIIYLDETCAIYLLVRPWVRRELRLENVSCAELVLFTLRKAFGRWELGLDDESCILRKLVLFTYLQGLVWDDNYDSKMLLVKNLCCLLNCKACGGPRVKTRRYIMYLDETCAIDFLVRHWVRRELRLESVSCEELVVFT